MWQSGSHSFQSSCPDGTALLSCGSQNYEAFYAEVYRSFKPLNSTTCDCWDYYSLICIALCTAKPVNDFQLVTTFSVGNFSATCPVGKRVLGCHLSPNRLNPQHDSLRSFYPTSDGLSCICLDLYGANCIATCASNVVDYEITTVQTQ